MLVWTEHCKHSGNYVDCNELLEYNCYVGSYKTNHKLLVILIILISSDDFDSIAISND